MAGALEGIRVVDLTAMFNGPLATMILADQGAEVVKIEPRGSGDIIREFGIRRGGISGIFQAVNRNKRSLALDLRDERGLDVALRLVDRADVFIQNFRPGVVERLGLAPDRLRERNPSLVTVSIRAFGAEGPMAARPAFDSVIQASSGMAASQAGSDGTPSLVHHAVCDKLTGLQVSQAVTAALFARERGAGGQHIEVSMLDASVAFLWPDAMQDHIYVDPKEPPPKRGWPQPMATTDGHLILSIITDAQYRAVCRALEAPELAADSRFEKIGERSRHLVELNDELSARCRRFTTDDLCARLEAEEAPFARVVSGEELPDHPQIQANHTFALRDDEHCGRLRVPNPVERFEKTPSTIRRNAPQLGEHGDEILRELGYSDTEREALRNEGVLSSP